MCTSSVKERLLDLSQNDEKYLKKMIRESSELECHERLKDHKAFYIFNLSYDGKIDQSDFSDLQTLYKKLQLVDIKGSPFPDNTAVIMSKNEVKYIFFNLQGFCRTTESIQEKVMRYTISKGGKYAIHILGSNISIYLTEIDGQMRVLDLRDGNLKVTEMKEYIDCCWNDFFPN